MYIINSTFGSPAIAWDPLPSTPVHCNHLVSITRLSVGRHARYHLLPVQMFTAGSDNHHEKLQIWRIQIQSLLTNQDD